MSGGLHRVIRVVDGDTIIVEPRSIVRLIGVDTPETVKPNHAIEPFGPEATEFTKQFVAGGTVRLSFDRRRVDRFGRYLAYVWVGPRLLNEQLLLVGLARFEPQFDYSESMKLRFQTAQERARRARIGIWSLEPDRVDGRSCRGDAWESRMNGPANRVYCRRPRRRGRAAFISLKATTEYDHGQSQTHPGRLPYGHALSGHPGSGRSPRFL